MLQETERAVLEAVPKATDEAADATLAHIKRRTGRGVGTNERAFVEYARGYARREKGGRRRPVTLVRQGDMMNNLRIVKEGATRRVIKFSSRREERKGRTHHEGRGRLPRRRWFGLTTRFARRLVPQFARSVEARLPRDRRRRFQVRITL